MQIKWQPIETAPKDATLVLLAVDFKDNPHRTYDTDGLSRTIGFNSLDNTGEDVWSIAGWNWEQDCFCEAEGEPKLWAAMPPVGKEADNA